MKTPSVNVRASDLDSLEDVGRKMLPTRTDKIVDGRLNGTHWFVAVMSDAQAIVRRRRAWNARRK